MSDLVSTRRKVATLHGFTVTDNGLFDECLMCGAGFSLDFDEDPCPSCSSKREMEREEFLASMLGRIGNKKVEAFYSKNGDNAYIVYTVPLPGARIAVRCSDVRGST